MSKQITSTEFLQGSRAIVDISGYTHRGLGVARVQGRVIFVQGALRGEQVEVVITGQKKKVLQGRVSKIIRSSAERTSPICPIFDSCGGCHLQHISYAEELYFKTEQVAAALRRIAKITDKIELQPIIPADELYHYRNKGIFHLLHGDTKTSLCFWDEGSHNPAADCCTMLFAPNINALTNWLQNESLPPNLSDIMIRRSSANGDLMLAAILKDSNRNSILHLLESAVEKFPDVKVIASQTPSGWQVHSATDCLTDCLGNTFYQLSAASFFQINNEQTLKLLKTATNLLKNNCQTVVDAYCGIGTIGLYLAKHLPNIKHLTGIELNESAVQNARTNAKLNNITNAEFFAGKAEVLFAKAAGAEKPDVVIIDPPRRGCNITLLNSLLDLYPQNILYVSCNPATLARDLAILLNGGYQLSYIQPIDMFPRTYHVETVVLLSQKNN